MKIKRIIAKMLHMHSSPREIALGIAVGVFIAVLPVYGLHTLLLVVLALIIRPANKIAMLIGTNISLPPTVPFITWSGYEIGRFILDKSLAPLCWSDFRNITFQKVTAVYPVLFFGSVILGCVCAVVAYVLTYFIFKAYKEKRAHAARAASQDKIVQ
ncbi:MAG: DUF2062 domain-containing protein [Candidatus Omnitrophota bacterium]|nr:DUF2062 domain-containing protein [Candidatus Omnitrophota bacterium]